VPRRAGAGDGRAGEAGQPMDDVPNRLRRPLLIDLKLSGA
jgi:hypothetical protein